MGLLDKFRRREPPTMAWWDRVAPVVKAAEDQALEDATDDTIAYVEEDLGLTGDPHVALKASIAIVGLAQSKPLPAFLAPSPFTGDVTGAFLRELLSAADCEDLATGPEKEIIAATLAAHYDAYRRMVAGNVLYRVVAGTYPDSAPRQRSYEALATAGVLPPTWDQRVARLQTS